ncbi:MAG: DUF2085 domain-containing protein [Acidimicrobiia bacterium]
MILALAIIFAIGGVVCHQLPERSFFIGTHQLPVCARCTGLYASAVAGFVTWCLLKLVRRGGGIEVSPRSALVVLAVAAVPTVLSVAGGVSGVADGTNVGRALLAIPLGATAGAIVAAVATKDLR